MYRLRLICTTKHLFCIFLATVVIIAASSCTSKSNPLQQDDAADYKVEYAKGFTVKKYAGFTEVSVRDPWDTTRLLQKYILVDRNKELPAQLPKGTVVKVPLTNVVAYSSIHCSTLNELGAIGVVRGVCEPEYINIQEIQDGVKNGKVIALGMASNPDVEKIIDLSPEAILTTPISGQSYGSVIKTGIPMIETPDYTEPNPLGRAEWIRFYSLFLDKEQLADSLFAITATNYNRVKEIASKAESRPTMFPDLRYMGTWNMPGGKSYMANMIADAGGRYSWSDDNSSTYLPLSFEAVLDKAGDADLWLIKYFAPKDMDYVALEKEYRSYTYFKAFKEKKIWGCNTMYSKYYEDLPIHPDWILQDFAYIFHPHLFTDYTPRYYKPFAY